MSIALFRGLPSTVFVTSLLLAPGSTSATAQQDSSDADGRHAPRVLFDHHDPLHLTLTTDLRTLIRDIDSTKFEQHPARLTYRTDGGDSATLDIRVRTRGHFRRQRKNCRFPPLRLNIKTGDAAETIFAGQDKLKLVTHCQNGRKQYAQYVVLEYLVYRTLNLLTDISFRARLADVTYVDTEGREDTRTAPGILLESEQELVERLGATEVDVQGVSPADIDPAYMTLVDVFQYMVGNTDWSVSTLHNIFLVDVNFTYYAIPYDFDWTGLVNARYARPDHRLPIRSVRDRLYRGTCHGPEELATTIALFEERRDTIYALYRDTPELDDGTRRKALNYLDDFYDVIGNRGRARRELSSYRCNDE